MADLFGETPPAELLRVSPPVEHEFALTKSHPRRGVSLQPSLFGLLPVPYGPALAKVVLKEA